MRESTFPTLINSKAKLTLGLTRTELFSSSGVYTLLSIINCHGLITIFAVIATFVTVRTFTHKIPKGFIRGLSRRRHLLWFRSVEGIYE